MRTRRAAAAGLIALALGTAGIAIEAAPEVAAADQASPAVVVTGQAVGVAQNTATLTGTVNTENSETVYEFDLGTDTSYGTRIFGEAGDEPGEQTFSSTLQGLAPGTTYHYRIAATNTFGTSYGIDETFTTSSYPTATFVAPVTPPLLPTPLLAPAPASTAKAASIKPAARLATRRKAGKHGGSGSMKSNRAKRKDGRGDAGSARGNRGGGKR